MRMNNYPSKITVSLPVGLIRQLDEVAKSLYETRSGVIRRATQEWMQSDPRRARIAAKAVGKPDPGRPAIKRLLTVKQLKVLDEYKQGHLLYQDLLDAGITNEIQGKLMHLGEL